MLSPVLNQLLTAIDKTNHLTKAEDDNNETI